MLLLTSGTPRQTEIELRTRTNNRIDNLQPWSYSHFEWKQLDEAPNKYENLGAVRLGEMCPIYNCHGLTFASRRTQVDGSNVTISMILADDGYVEVPEKNCTTGDVVVYYGSDGNVEHSGIVLGRGDMNVPRVWSKWGKGCEMYHPLGACPWSGFPVRFYRMSKWKFEEFFNKNS